MTVEEHFGDYLARVCAEKRSAVCVGLDPRWQNFPEEIKDNVDANDLTTIAKVTTAFCREVIDAVADFSAVVKPQAAFFEQLGPAGLSGLHTVIQHIRQSGMIALLDGKRGDIGSTATGYAEAYLGRRSPWSCDALTVNPYLGDDTLTPFVETASASGAGIFVLVKTSNPGSGFLQDLKCGQSTVFERVAMHVQSLARESAGKSGFGNVGAVVGATYPKQLTLLRDAMPNAWILIPGFGAQGGTAADVAYGFRLGTGAIVNSSRGIIFAYQQQRFTHMQWQQAIAEAAKDMRDQIEDAIGRG